MHYIQFCLFFPGFERDVRQASFQPRHPPITYFISYVQVLMPCMFVRSVFMLFCSSEKCMYEQQTRQNRVDHDSNEGKK